MGPRTERKIFIDNLLVRHHSIIVMIRWTGLAPWEFECPFSGSLTSTFLGPRTHIRIVPHVSSSYKGACTVAGISKRGSRPQRPTGVPRS